MSTTMTPVTAETRLNAAAFVVVLKAAMFFGDLERFSDAQLLSLRTRLRAALAHLDRADVDAPRDVMDAARVTLADLTLTLRAR